MIKPIWFEDINTKVYPSLNENIKTKILIIGGGITGISCAYELSEVCNDITIVTMNDFFEGTTGATTAKITFQHGYLYHDLIKKVGIENAQAYYHLNKKGLDRLKEIIYQEKIDCDFEEVDSYLYSYNDEENNLKKEVKAYNSLGIKSQTTEIEHFDRIALKISQQGQFHPLKYLSKLLEILKQRNVRIFRNTQVKDISKHLVKTKHYTITADNIIIATGYPVYSNHRFFFTKLIPSISYVVTGIPQKHIENGNYINTKNPIIALRYHKDMLILSGMSHNSSEMPDYNFKYQQLIDVAKTHFSIDEFPSSWSTRDYTSVDLLPFIGKVNKFTYIATGYGAWGMTNSVGASLLIKDIYLRKNNPHIKVFTPRRFICNKKFLFYNIKTINTIIKSKKRFDKIKDIELTEGKIVRIGLTRFGIYRDEDNNIHISKAKCTHLGCGLTLNKVDRVYECPCHGSRFNYNGKVIHGPAKEKLPSVVVKNKKE